MTAEPRVAAVAIASIRRRRLRLLGIVAVVAMTFVAACGSDSPSTGSATSTASTAAAASSAGAATTAAPTSKKPDVVRIVYFPGVVAIAPGIVPNLTGAYAAEGIEIEWITASSSPVSLLVSGEADLSFFAVFGAVTATQTDAPPMRLIYQMGSATTNAYAAAKAGVTTLADCERLGTTSANTASYAWAEYLKSTNDYPYTVVPIADNAAQAAALASGNTDCSMGTYGALSQLVASGDAHWILNPEMPSTLPKDFPLNIVSGGLVGLDSWLTSHHDLVVRLVKALNQALPQIRGPAAPLADLLATQEDFAAIEKASLLDQVVHSQPFMSPADGFVSPDLWADQLKWMKAGGAGYVDPADPKWGIENFIDMTYYNEANELP